MTRFTDYTDRVDAGDVRLDWRHELIAPDGQILATTYPDEATGDAIKWGASMQPLDFAGSGVSQRTSQLRVPVTDSTLLPTSTGSLLHPSSGNRVRTSAGVISGSDTIWRVQSTMLADVVSAEAAGGAVEITLSLVDTTRPARSKLTGAIEFDLDDTVDSVVTTLLAEVYDTDQYSVTATGWTVPGGSLEIGADRWQAINDLLEGCGHELVTTPLGLVVTRPIPPSGPSDVGGRWAYGTGGIPVTRARRVWPVRQPQGFQVQGGSLQTSDTSISVIVWDTDPSSEGHFAGQAEVELPTRRYPYIRQVGQAAAAGYGQLRRHGTGPMIVEFETLPNPMLMEGDLIDLDLPELGVDRDMRVLSYQLPVEVDGLMTVRCRGTYDPAINYTSPLDRGEGCLVSFSDNFERADENLEDLVTSPGSPDWTEVGYSWGVVGGRAIQRFDRGWSMALVNTPLCSTGQYAEMGVAVTPTGRFIGPVVRSSGEFDGYAAVADASGRINLEMWLAGAKVATLGSYDSGGSITGKTLRVTASGTTITVRVDSTDVITASDDRRVGAHVGMLAYGGHTGQAPAAESFASGAA